jgi:hypothetical protein
MRIHCLTTFLDGTRRFEQDDKVTVSDEDGARFIKNGWAASEDGGVNPAPVGDVTLDVQDSTLGHKTVTGG